MNDWFRRVSRSAGDVNYSPPRSRVDDGLASTVSVLQELAILSRSEDFSASSRSRRGGLHFPQEGRGPTT